MTAPKKILRPKGRVLYMTDQFGISSGYQPRFDSVCKSVNIPRHIVIIASVYRLVPDALKKVGNQTHWRYNAERLGEIKAAFDARINTIKPSVIVCSCPALLGLFVSDVASATLEKQRGSVYFYRDIPVIITFPVTVVNQRVDATLLKDVDGEDVSEQPYLYPSGEWIYTRDWEKAARFLYGVQRRVPAFRYSVCRNRADLDALLAYAKDSVAVAKDIETGCFPAQITCDGMTFLHKSGELRAFVIPFYDPTNEYGVFWERFDDHEYAYNVMKQVNDLNLIAFMHNGNYDNAYYIRDRVPVRNFKFDTMAMFWAMYMELPKTLGFVTSILLDQHQFWKDDIDGIKSENLTRKGMETYWRYCAMDTFNTMLIGQIMLGLLCTENATPFRLTYLDAMQRIFVGLNMGMRGVKADFNKREEHRELLTKEADMAEGRLRFLIDEPDFNASSPAQKLSLLYDVLGARPRNAKGRYTTRDAKGIGKAPSSGAIAMKMIRTESPLFGIIIDAIDAVQTPRKQISNVCNMKIYTDRFRSNFNAIGTETTRFSSSSSQFWDGGNAQNIRKKMRNWLVADPHCIFMEIDYSQSDDVFVAYESEDLTKIELIQSGKDGHAVHGEMFFGKPYDEIVAGKRAGDPNIVHPTKGIRQLAKRVVHGCNFVMAALTLYMTMGREAMVAAATLGGNPDAERWSQEQLVDFGAGLMRRYRQRYRRLNEKEWYKDLCMHISQHGHLTNAFGVTRRFLGKPFDSGTMRTAAAYMGQSGTAGNMNRSANEIFHGYIPANFRDGPNYCQFDTPLQMTYESHGLSMLLQVHDSFVLSLDTRHPKWKEAASNVLQVMERPVLIHGRDVSVGTEAEFGVTWGTGHIEWSRDPKQLPEIEALLSEQKKKAGIL